MLSRAKHNVLPFDKLRVTELFKGLFSKKVLTRLPV